MKIKLVISTLLLFAVFIAAKPVVYDIQPGADVPKIEFEKMIHDFGQIKEGEIVGARFVFKNSGKVPLIITQVERPCSCTDPKYPKKPIMPGDTGSISIRYSSKGRPGIFRKTFTVTTNIITTHPPILMIKGEAVKGKH